MDYSCIYEIRLRKTIILLVTWKPTMSSYSWCWILAFMRHGTTKAKGNLMLRSEGTALTIYAIILFMWLRGLIPAIEL